MSKHTNRRRSSAQKPSASPLRRSALSLAIAGALAQGAFGQSAWAAPSTTCPSANGSGVIVIPNGTTVTAVEQDACVLAAGQSISVQSGGGIVFSQDAFVGDPGAINGVVVPTAVTANNITNAGAISLTGSNSRNGIYVAGGVLKGIQNSGSIAGLAGSTSVGIVVSGAGSSVQGGISNSGSVNGNEGAFVINGNISGGIVNSSGALITGGRGLLVGFDAVIDSITNAGVIRSKDNAGYSFGSAISIFGGAPGSGITALTNGVTGEIGGPLSWTNPDYLGNDGVVVFSGALGTLSNSGRIFGSGSGAGVGVHVIRSVVTTINNAGVIEGPAAGVRLGYNSFTAAQVDSLINGAAGTIQATEAAGHGLWIDGAEGAITSVVQNAGTIAGGASGVGFLVDCAGLTGSLSNTGTISGGAAAIRVNGCGGDPVVSNIISGGITNSGLISGAVELAGVTLNLNGPSGRITGATSGDSLSRVNVNGTFTSENTFTVGHFEIASTGVFKMKHAVTVSTSTTFVNAGVLEVAATDTASITGPYSQVSSGTYRIGANSTSAFGKTAVVGSAVFPAAAKINVVVSNCGAFAPGNVLPAVFSATSMTTTTFVVTDNCPAFDFVASRNGNAIDLSIVAVAPPPEPQPIPTLGAWALMFLSFLMTSLGLRRLAPVAGKAD